MANKFVIVEKKGHLTIIKINRPEAMNALHPPAHQELDSAFNEFADDPEARVAILTATGDKVFCPGNDLKYLAQHGAEEVKKSIAGLTGGFGGITSRFDLFKPVIAAVNGTALGGGTEIVLACDIIIAAENAKLGLPEPRVGLMAGSGGVHRLPRQIPYHLAMGYILTGQQMSTKEALAAGLINEVVPLSDLMAAAERWANEIIECSPLAVRASKQAALLGLGYPIDEAVKTRFSLLNEMMQSEDMQEGPRAFAEKRKPQWKGR